jgi:hypothetical protein
VEPDSLAVSIHGPAGVVDLLVPPGAQAVDLAREYAEQSGLAAIPLIFSLGGVAVRPDMALDEAGVHTGDILVAATGVHRQTGRARRVGVPLLAGNERGAGAWFTVAGFLAAFAGWFAAHSVPDVRPTVVGVLLGAAFIGVLPFGVFTSRRVLVAPAFAAAAAFALVWSPVPERLPMVLGITGLAGAIAASAGRALATGPDEGLRVWMIAGAGTFLVTGAITMAGFGPPVAYGTLVLLAVLAARFVPMLAIDVPDHYLLDLDRLAVNAWSAREQPAGKRGRTLVAPQLVAEVAARGARVVTSACVAIGVLVTVCAFLLLRDTAESLDLVGARGVVFFAGAATLLAARSYRHVAARALLRLGGLAAWTVLAWDLLAGSGHDVRGLSLALVCVALGLVLVVAAVATGRGWRSVWWSRRAEVAEGFCAAATLAALVVSCGLFRALWEMGT